MKSFAIEIFFRKNGAPSDGIDDAPRLEGYVSDTLLERFTDTTLDGVKRQVHHQYPGAAYLHILDIREYDSPLSSEYAAVTAVDNIPGTAIKSSSLHGYGLFAERVIRKGTVLAILEGQKVDYNFNAGMARFIEWNAVGDGQILVRPYRTKYSFINHSRGPTVASRCARECRAFAYWH